MDRVVSGAYELIVKRRGVVPTLHKCQPPRGTYDSISRKYAHVKFLPHRSPELPKSLENSWEGGGTMERCCAILDHGVHCGSDLLHTVSKIFSGNENYCFDREGQG